MSRKVHSPLAATRPPAVPLSVPPPLLQLFCLLFSERERIGGEDGGEAGGPEAAERGGRGPGGEAGGSEEAERGGRGRAQKLSGHGGHFSVGGHTGTSLLFPGRFYHDCGAIYRLHT